MHYCSVGGVSGGRFVDPHPIHCQHVLPGAHLRSSGGRQQQAFFPKGGKSHNYCEILLFNTQSSYAFQKPMWDDTERINIEEKVSSLFYFPLMLPIEK